MPPPDVAPVKSRHKKGRARKRLRKRVSESLAGAALLLVKVVCLTLRIRRYDEERFLNAEGGRILCMWHGRTIPPAARYRGQDITILISLSRDGELIANILSSLGYPALRGSSGPSGARVLASCIKLLRSGRTLAVTPDGPRGPSGVLRGGVMTMARKSGALLVPVGSSVRPRIAMTKSWDRFLMPLPFARAVMVFGEPMRVPPDADEEAMVELTARFQAEMRRIQDEADRKLGMPTHAEMAVPD